MKGLSWSKACGPLGRQLFCLGMLSIWQVQRRATSNTTRQVRTLRNTSLSSRFCGIHPVHPVWSIPGLTAGSLPSCCPHVRDSCQTVGFGDELLFRKLPGATKDEFDCNMPGVPKDGSNLVLRALDLFRQRTSTQDFYEVRVLHSSRSRGKYSNHVV